MAVTGWAIYPVQDAWHDLYNSTFICSLMYKLTWKFNRCDLNSWDPGLTEVQVSRSAMVLILHRPWELATSSSTQLYHSLFWPTGAHCSHLHSYPTVVKRKNTECPHSLLLLHVTSGAPAGASPHMYMDRIISTAYPWPLLDCSRKSFLVHS